METDRGLDPKRGGGRFLGPAGHRPGGVRLFHMPPVPLRVIHRVAIDPAEVTTKRTILWVMTSTVWNEIDPNLLDITARLADVLTRPDREALTAYLTAAEPAPVPAQDQIDVLSRAAHDLDTLALIAMAWPFTQ